MIAHFKYKGDDFDRDMNGIKEDEETRKWWGLTDGMQESLIEGAKGSDGEGGWWLVSDLLCSVDQNCLAESWVLESARGVSIRRLS